MPEEMPEEMPKCPKKCRNARRNARRNAQGRNRTTDTRIFNPLLYRLSYLGIRYSSLLFLAALLAALGDL